MATPSSLNSVLTDVTLLGNASYQFWTQNDAEYFAQSHVLDLVSNVWNFSSDYLSNNSILSHGPHGIVTTGLFYMANVTLTGVTYPFNLTLFLNSTTAQGNDRVNFTAVLGTAGSTQSYAYDYVVFNSIAPGGTPVLGPAEYSANGFGYNPVGLPDDFELVLGGPGGGSQVNLLDSDATLSLRYALSPGVYAAVPSALSFGGDSGESASGVNVEWTNGSAGPVRYALDWPVDSVGIVERVRPSGRGDGPGDGAAYRRVRFRSGRRE